MFITDLVWKLIFLNFSSSKGNHVCILSREELHVLWLGIGLWGFFLLFSLFSDTKVTNCNEGWTYFIYMRHVSGNRKPKWFSYSSSAKGEFPVLCRAFQTSRHLKMSVSISLMLEDSSHFGLLQAATFLHFLKTTFILKLKKKNEAIKGK